MQIAYEILEGVMKVTEKDAVRLAALQYCLQPLTAKMLTQIYIHYQECGFVIIIMIL